ncbi:hypothetical protein KSP40_PGU009801 [Platanthera guangdongensis]|uniref:DUF674 family protein n=1 Tax=Platanthera guangdongensis TaxID=2320717 RepID=A0ABR2MT97_9ASPA
MAKPVKLNLIGDKSSKRVIFAESNGHFVDILLSFLTLPLGSILQLTKQSIGSMNNLLKSVETIDSVCFSSEACRSMLLCPSNSASHLLSSLDDLLVSQSSVEFSIEQLSKLDVKQMSSLESVSVDVIAENIVELLKRLLVSDTPLTDVFLGVHKVKDKLQVDIQQSLHAKCYETQAPTASMRNISLKLYVNKDDDTAVIAEADKDFVDLLFGFLTYPIGAVISKLGGHSGFRCMDNIYNSVEALKPSNCFRNNELIGKLLNPKLPQFFKVKK